MREFRKKSLMVICLVLNMVLISACAPEMGETKQNTTVLPSHFPDNVVFKNGAIYTSNHKQDMTEAVAIKVGRI
ncbi:hypothetical protein ACQKN7_09800 [Bacillus cereus]|uniref:hypothetical protein n=1 Tax=Bacillus cereus TaxID=1396 RepID=UPI003CFCB03B